MLISVIIPVYKNINLLNDSLKSLKKQTFKNFEVIIINDGAKEISKIKQIINNFKKSLTIKFIDQKNNYGVSHALNTGIKKAKGKYISWLSSDDYFHPKIFEYQIKAIDKKNLCITGFFCVDSKKKIFKKIKYDNLSFSPKNHILLRDNFNFCTILIKKNIFFKVGLFNKKLRHVQDYEMMFRIFEKYEPIIINKCLLYSRHHKGQTSIISQRKAIFEKEKLYLSKVHLIKKMFKKSNVIEKVLIIFFIRLKNIDKLNQILIELTNKENLIISIILKFAYVTGKKYIFFKKKIS